VPSTNTAFVHRNAYMNIALDVFFLDAHEQADAMAFMDRFMTTLGRFRVASSTRTIPAPTTRTIAGIIGVKASVRYLPLRINTIPRTSSGILRAFQQYRRTRRRPFAPPPHPRSSPSRRNRLRALLTAKGGFMDRLIGFSIRPPMALARLGGSETPLESFEWVAGRGARAESRPSSDLRRAFMSTRMVRSSRTCRKRSVLRTMERSDRSHRFSSFG